MRKYGLIYKIANDINDKIYIGQTKQILNKRIVQHISKAKKGCVTPLYNSIRKYGWNHFTVEILEDNISVNKVCKREIYWVNKLKSFYPNGYNCMAGETHKIFSQFTKDKISKNHADFSGNKNPAARAVLCYDLDNNFIKEYPYIKMAADELGVNPTNISSVCRGYQKTSVNMIWKYKND